MTAVHSLEQTLSDNLPWNRARIKFLSRFLTALFITRTVNLSILATAFSGRAKEESNYKRLQRFFKDFNLPYAQLSMFVVKMLGIPGPYTLALDRTNWKVGSANINILMLSIVHQGTGFPVVWNVLPKAGNSDTTERETVIEIFIDLFGASNIACLLGDREFIGKNWFNFLRRHEIKFQMRLHRDTLVVNSRGKLVNAWRLFAATKIDRLMVISMARRMWGQDLYLSGCRLINGEYLILVSPEYVDSPGEQYSKRWGIETLFGSLKSRGFNLEDTRIQDPERICRLVALLAIAFTWAFVVGSWQAIVKDLKLKKHGYPARSIFRIGINMICRLLINLRPSDLDDWQRVIKLLSCS